MMAKQPMDSANAGNALASLTNVLNLLAPLVVVFSAMLYLAGWTYGARMLSPFGLRSYMLEYSLQDTLALGFIPMFVGTLMIFLLFITVGTFGMALRKTRFVAGLPRIRLSAWTRFNVMLFAAAVLLSFGFIAGSIIGKRSADRIFRVVEQGCKKGCQTYVVGGQGITGRLITQDKSRTLVLTNSGVVILKNDDLTRAIPVGLKHDFVEF